MQRLTYFVLIAFSFVLVQGAHAQTVTLVAGGDVEWSRITYQPDVYYDNPEPAGGEWRRVPYLNSADTRAFIGETYTRIVEDSSSHHLRSIHYDLSFDSDQEMARHPFQRIAPLLREASIAFVNLETPLSDSARWKGAFRTPEAFAEGMQWAGIDVANLANNHALDAEGEGLMDTMEALRRTGIGKIGAGTDLEDATRPLIVEREGIRFAFLGYTAFENSGPSSFAQSDKGESPDRARFVRPSRSGVAAMDPFLIKENIASVRDEVDYVVVSFHWNIENSQDTHPGARQFAKEIIDAGADVILGHHPHVPRGVEIYNGKPIFYCPGNFIFGHNHTYWMDNYLAHLTFTPDRIERVEIHPIAGAGQDLAQPYPLEDERAQKLLKDVQRRTAALDTEMTIEGDIGVIRIDE